MLWMEPADDGQGGIIGIIGGIGNAINGAAGVVSYWSDPWGNTFKMLRDTAQGMSRDIMPALTSATLPDLTADWFINAYKISFARRAAPKPAATWSSPSACTLERF
jgi:hypothetical protein